MLARLKQSGWVKIGAAWTACLGVLPIFDALGLTERIAKEGHLSSTYLWTSLFGTVALAMVLAWQVKNSHSAQLRLEGCETERINEVSRERALQKSASKLVHMCSELVREFATDGNKWDSQKANYVLGDLLDDFLHRLTQTSPEVKFRVTVKRAVVEGSEDRVRTLFRCKNQSEARKSRDDVSWDESLIMRTFKEAYDQAKSTQIQWMHIDDLPQYPGVPASYRESLTKLEVASILGFPLRGHATAVPGGRFSKLLGFISIDCSESCVFSKLFSDSAVKERQALEVFFAIADALATILVIESRRSKTGS